MSRRFVAFLGLMIFAVAIGSLAYAQTRRGGILPGSLRPRGGAAAQRNAIPPRPVQGPRPPGLSPVSSDGSSIAPWVPVRSTVGVPGFERQQRANGRPGTRVPIGGAGGANVPEQIVNVTQAPPDDIHPVWSADQQFLFFASNRELGKYQLFQVAANASADPASPAPAAPRRLTNDPTSDFLFPAINRQQLPCGLCPLDQRRCAPVVRRRHSGDRLY
jgi:hypothetical protein